MKSCEDRESIVTGGHGLTLLHAQALDMPGYEEGWNALTVQPTEHDVKLATCKRKHEHHVPDVTSLPPTPKSPSSHASAKRRRDIAKLLSFRLSSLFSRDSKTEPVLPSEASAGPHPVLRIVNVAPDCARPEMAEANSSDALAKMKKNRSARLARWASGTRMPLTAEFANIGTGVC